MSAPLDDTDHQIIAELRVDGRQANTEIARRLGVSETTVRNRIQRLINEGIIQVAAIVNLSRLGYGVAVHLGIVCEPGRVPEVARVLSDIQEIRYLSFVAGRYDLLVAASFRSQDELLDFLMERVGRIPGIARTETLYELRIAKRGYYFWELPSVQQESSSGDRAGLSTRGETFSISV